MSHLLLVALALIGCTRGEETGPDLSQVDADGDGITADIDCDDDDPSVTRAPSFFADADADGYGNARDSQSACEAPNGFVEDPTDCDDEDAGVNPGAAEVCNAIDDDCDGVVDGESASDATTWYIDADGDGFGATTYSKITCAQPSGYVADGTDCDDLSEGSYPGSTEVCDGVDNDCNGTVDGDDATDRTAWYADADSDGFGDDSAVTVACVAPDGTVSTGGDCNDADASLNPTTEWFEDSDTDTYGNASATQVQCVQPAGYVLDATDCNDASDAAYPGGTEVCDEVDNDCNGDTDGSDAQNRPTWYADTDGDDYGDASATKQQCSTPDGYVADDADCDDTDAQINPLTQWYVDGDGDGYGVGAALVQCSVGDGYALLSADCDDTAASVYPNASQVCDDVDHDCDGNVDFDGDGDGLSAVSCGGADCDDSNADLTQCGLTPESALLDCKAIKAQGATEDGNYFIDPDDDGDTSNAIEVYCDMTTAGGGWTLTWLVDAEHFDGTFGNNVVVNPTAPVELNDQQDVWNPPTDLPVSEVLYGCTDNSNELSYWTYDSEASIDYWIGTTNYQYRHHEPSSATNSSFTAGCFAAHKGDSTYGFMVIQEGATSCGNCQGIVWGNYHYTSGGDCNNTDSSVGRHPSTVDGRSIGYPLCNKKQTNTGRFWIGVR